MSQFQNKNKTSTTCTANNTQFTGQSTSNSIFPAQFMLYSRV